MIALEYQILLALAFDLLLGDPRWLPHPVVYIGKLAAVSERISRASFSNERLAGIVAVLLVLTITAATATLLIFTTNWIHPWLGNLVSIVIIYFCMAAKGLASHSKAVQDALFEDDTPKARAKVAMIVGRDTSTLTQEEIARAGIESVAENIVDGITAPLIYAVIGGPIAVLVYKAINTLDSTFGYKNELYRNFGWAAARLDDLANFIPARISGVIMVFATLFCGLDAKRAWQIFWRDRLQHASPNAGHTEAVVAGALGIQLGGLNYYFGSAVAKPTIGDDLKPPQPRDIQQANRLLFMTLLISTLLFIGVRFWVTQIILP